MTDVSPPAHGVGAGAVRAGDIKLLLVRHGLTELNEARRYQGWSNPPLSSAGREGVEVLGTKLRDQDLVAGFDTIWVSDLLRCVETASILFRDLDVDIRTGGGILPPPLDCDGPGADGRGERIPMILDARLRELNFGVFEGATYDENMERHDPAFREWIADPGASPPPEGESLAQFRHRVNQWVIDLPTQGTVAVVLHGGSIGVIMDLLLDQETQVPAPGQAVLLYVVEDCFVSRLIL